MSATSKARLTFTPVCTGCLHRAPAPGLGRWQGDGVPSVYIATYLRDPAASSWPADVGDDPSFLASARFRSEGGQLSWGVCRADVRNRLENGDTVVFFAADRLRDRRPARYCFVGFATVERKVSQVEVWTHADLDVYRRYRNLLVRPAETGDFEHWEQQTPWHRDWLWRISETTGTRKPSFSVAEREPKFGPETRIDGRPLRIARNYVLFRPEGDETFIAMQPPIVAGASASGHVERWRDSAFARDLRSLVLDHSSRAGLRTTNPQQPHRHIRLRGVVPSGWRDDALALCRHHGIRARNGSA